MTDSRELTHHQPAGGAPAVQSESAGVLKMVLDAAKDPAIDAAKVETMANLAMKLQDRERESQFNRDLNAAIMDMPVITKAGIIIIPARDGRPARTQGRFARFEDIDRVVRPVLQRNNLALRFEVDESVRGVVSVRPILSHSNGHTERGGAMHLPLDDSGAKNKVQGVGSAVQYGKRYTMCALLNIVTEGSDDDGSLGRASITMPHERAETVLQEAEAAAAAGTYEQFFASQGVKDRAWLIDEGHHARLGGATPLPKPTATRTEEAEPARREDPPQDQKPAAATPDISTPEGWTAQYEKDCAGAPDLETLQRVQTKGQKGMDRLKAGHPELHERAVQAGTDAVARIRAGSAAGGSDLFTGEE